MASYTWRVRQGKLSSLWNKGSVIIPTIPVKRDQAFNDLEPTARLYFLKVYSPPTQYSYHWDSPKHVSSLYIWAIVYILRKCLLRKRSFLPLLDSPLSHFSSCSFRHWEFSSLCFNLLKLSTGIIIKPLTQVNILLEKKIILLIMRIILTSLKNA